MKKREAENNSQISQPRAHCTYTTRSLHRQLLSALLLLLVVAAGASVKAQVCTLVSEGGGQGISPTITIQSTGAELANGAVIPTGTALRLDAVANADGSCSQVGPGCFGEAERTINHINVQSDISTTGGLNGHYVEGYVFGDAYYHVLDTRSSSSTGPLYTTLFAPGTYEYHFWAVINTTACEIPPDQTETVTITIYVRDNGRDLGSGDCYSKAGKSRVGKPINVTNGNMYLQQTDYRLPGLGEGLDLTRTYNSQSTRTGIFGYGWTTPYEESLQLLGNSFMKLNLADGQAVFLAKRTTGEFTPQEPLDFRGQIVNNVDGSYTLTFKDGRVHQFNSSGKLLSLTDRNNNTITLSYDSNGRLTTVTDASGRTLTFAYTSNIVSSVSDSQGTIATYTSWWDRLETVRYPDGSGFNFYHNWSYNKLGIVTDVYGNYLESHTYDDAGHALTSQVANNGTELYTLNYVSATETDVTDALGHVTKYFYDTSKGRNVVTRVEGSCGCGSSQIQTWTYDNQLNVASKTDALGHTTSYTYDSNGNRLTETNPLGTTTYTYNSFGEILTLTDPMNGVWTNTYDSAGNLLTAKDALNNTTTFTYNSNGAPLTVTDPRNNPTTITYDTNGNLTRLTDALNNQTNVAYDTRGRVTSVTNALNQATSYEYDLAGRLKKITYPDANFVSATYDLAGRTTKIKDARGNDTNFAYDTAYRLTSVTNAANAVTSYTYDSMSNLTGVTDPLNRTTNYTYDDFERLTRIKYPEASTGAGRLEENFAYDAAGNLLQKTDQSGRVTSFCYDAANRLITSTDPALKVTSYEYNARSQMTAVVNAINQRYEFVHDALGRPTQEKKGALTKSFVYDAAGNRTQRTDFNGAVTNYSFDALNRLTTIGYPDTTSATYGYDALSRLATATNPNGTVTIGYDNRGRVSSVTDVFGQVVGYAYDANSNRTQLSLNSGTSATYQYDVLNRLTQLADAASLNTTFGYDVTNKLTSRTLPNGVATAYQYDGLDRLTRLTHSKGANTLADFQYQFNAVGSITQIIDGAGTHNYTYDTRDRLTAATHPNQTNESYMFDDVGNRTASQQGSSYTYQTFNRLVAANGSSFGYDAKGNLTSKTDASGSWTYAWDYENRLKQASLSGGVSVTYIFDALGRRIQRTSSAGASTKFVYDGADAVRDLDGNGATIADYLNGPGVDNKLRQSVAGTASYFLQDHLGTTRAFADASGNGTSNLSYDSFGNVTNASASTRYTYTGREFDSDTGVMYYRARWYDSHTGRFISEDPIGLAGGINQFAYVGNNPPNAKDPSGLYEIDVHYYLTYFLAMKTSCFTTHEARLIADADQATDENGSTSPGLGWTAQQRSQNRGYHDLQPGNYEGQGSPELWQEAMNGSTNYVGLGRYFHFLQDSFSHAAYQSDVYGHLFGLHYYDKTASDVPRALRMAGATWNALNEYAEKKCGCRGKWNASWWQQVVDFSGAQGANFGALETIDSNGEIENFGMTNNRLYLLRKIGILGLSPR
jgi:RHS repeat-associated protein